MARRKEFKTIASGLLSSFVSRNNDVYGYWGIGKLYSHMVASKSMTLKIDLIYKKIEPKNIEFEVLISEFYERMMTQIKNRRINIDHLKSAEIILEGFPNEPITSLGQIAPNKMNCKLNIKDDLNRTHSSEANVQCSEHNPNKESKSGRKYKINENTTMAIPNISFIGKLKDLIS